MLLAGCCSLLVMNQHTNRNQCNVLQIFYIHPVTSMSLVSGAGVQLFTWRILVLAAPLPAHWHSLTPQYLSCGFCFAGWAGGGRNGGKEQPDRRQNINIVIKFAYIVRVKPMGRVPPSMSDQAGRQAVRARRHKLGHSAVVMCYCCGG